MLVTGPTGRYYLLENDSSIRTLQSALSNQFSVLQLFVVDEGETTVVIPNICDLNKPYPVVPVEVATDCESNEEDEDQNEPILLITIVMSWKSLKKEKNREINDKLEKFLELENGMCFQVVKNLNEL